MWSTRLLNGVKACGHEAVLVERFGGEFGEGEVAIVNLGSGRLMSSGLIGRLKEAGIVVIGHAGHKEKELMAAGRAAGCDMVVTHSAMAEDLGKVLSGAVQGS